MARTRLFTGEALRRGWRPRVRAVAPFLVLAVILLYSAWTPASLLMSEWESLTIYSIYGTPAVDLNFALAPNANIAFQGYAPLEISKTLLRLVGLSPTLDNIRLPSVGFGLASLVLVFVIVSRWFSKWPAVVASAFLAVNPTFLQYQHELIITAASFFSLTLLVERLQYVSRKQDSLLAWVTLTVSLSFALSLYGPSRIAAAALYLAWLVGLQINWSTRSSGQRRRVLLLKTILPIAGAGLLLVSIDPRNVRFLGPQLIFPNNAESIFTYPTSPSSLLDVLHMNGRIILESVALGGGNLHSSMIEATLIQGRFPLLTLIFVPFVAVGAAITSYNWWKEGLSVLSRWSGVMVMTVVTLVPPIFSSTFEFAFNENSSKSFIGSSLVNYRLYFFLLPAAIFVGIFSWWLMSLRTSLRVTGISLLLLVSIWSAASNISSRANFEKTLATVVPEISGPSAQEQWPSELTVDDRTRRWTSHLTQHNQYRSWAAAKAGTMQTGHSAACPTVISAPISTFGEAPLNPHSLDSFIAARNYHSVFLSIYLASERSDLTPAFVFMTPMGKPQDFVYGKLAPWSAFLGHDSSGEFEYLDADTDAARIISLNARPPNVVLTTTPDEESLVTDLFSCTRAETLD